MDDKRNGTIVICVVMLSSFMSISQKWEKTAKPAKNQNAKNAKKACPSCKAGSAPLSADKAGFASDFALSAVK